MPLMMNVNQARELKKLKDEYDPTPLQPIKPFGGDQGEFDKSKTMEGPQGQRMTPAEHARMMEAALRMRGR